MKSDNKIGNLFRNTDVLAAHGALIPLVGVTFFGVIMCYCLGDLFIWQEEAQLALIIWVVFLEGGYAFVCGNHMAIDVITEMLPRKLRRLLNVFIAAAVVIILYYVGYQGVRYIIRMVRHDRMTSILKVPYSSTYAPLPIGCLTMVVQIYLSTYGDLTGEKEGV